MKASTICTSRKSLNRQEIYVKSMHIAEMSISLRNYSHVVGRACIYMFATVQNMHNIITCEHSVYEIYFFLPQIY